MGTEFDQNMFGFEADPLELIIDLLNELEANNQQLKFTKFKDQVILKSQINEILNSENEQKKIIYNANPQPHRFHANRSWQQALSE